MSIMFNLEQLKHLINEYGNRPIKEIIKLEQRKRLLNMPPAKMSI
ncbi:MAG: hypothetical protein ACRC7S_17490 [Cetobacterium sp.]